MSATVKVVRPGRKPRRALRMALEEAQDVGLDALDDLAEIAECYGLTLEEWDRVVEACVREMDSIRRRGLMLAAGQGEGWAAEVLARRQVRRRPGGN
jgi:hypothetical protein